MIGTCSAITGDSVFADGNMIRQETVESAVKWCEIGARWIKNGATRLGLNYLERAIAVFAEGSELSWLTFARHQKMDGLIQSGREDDALAMFDAIMEGYSRLGDSYGKSLLLTHLADCAARQGRSERAMLNLNLAHSIATSEGLKRLLAHILAQQGRLAMERKNFFESIKLFREAELLLEEQEMEVDSMLLRFAATKAMVEMGETAEAIALLEDLQSRLIKKHSFQEVIEPLHMLGRLYEESGSWDEKNRVAQLVHFCSQHLIKKGGETKAPKGGEPLIRPFTGKNEEDGEN